MIPVDVQAMEALLAPPGHVPAIGTETLVRTTTAAGVVIVHTSSATGTVRYVAHVGGAPAAVLQLVTMDGSVALICNAYTVPTLRRTGLARMLLERARADHDRVVHATHLSEDGAAFARAVG